jgi:hypothetical protein
MDVLVERACSLDVHKRTVVACLITPGPAGKPGTPWVDTAGEP